ncbi:hypothetical protein J4Q44_G00069030 [Coregonus suidteri]|uniref:Uncharacterized protein n=1 Tax=Coregonus suidteri TaxID=861788 RepID=A0AAN8N5N3_9TELE
MPSWRCMRSLCDALFFSSEELQADHACVRDEAVHRDARPELRPTSSHKSRALDCKISERFATIKSSASLVTR